MQPEGRYVRKLLVGAAAAAGIVTVGFSFGANTPTISNLVGLFVFYFSLIGACGLLARRFWMIVRSHRRA